MNSVGRTVSRVGLVAAIAVAIIGVAVPAAAAAPVSAPVPTAVTPAVSIIPADTGADISYPQCSGTSIESPSPLAGRPFAIIGVNGGKASTFNHCFSSQYAAAQIIPVPKMEQPIAAVYLNTGDPALAASWWPSKNETQGGTAGSTPITVPTSYGTCAHKAGSACAFVYGYSVAQADYATVTGGPNNFTAPPIWWLDVETTNTWQTDTAANAASLSGMKTFLASKGQSVGIYSTAYQWKKIAGTTSSTSVLANLPTWLAGASTTSAAGDCSTLAALTPGGRVSLVQYVSGTPNLDNDLSCHIFAPPALTITGALYVGQKLTANHGTWSTGTVAYTYQWYRSGVAISGATSSLYTLTSTDVGKNISVKITGRESGYNPKSAVSASTAAISKILTLQPKPTGSQWLGGGQPIEGATSPSYAP